MKYLAEPKREIDGNVETCEPKDADFWGVYEVGDDGLPMHLFDCVSEDDALVAVAMLEKK